MDKPIVEVLSVQQIDWSVFAEVADTYLGKKVLSTVDSFGVRVDEQTAFLAAVEYLRTGETNVWKAVAASRHTAARHLFLSFLIVCEDDSAIKLLEPGLIKFTRICNEGHSVLIAGATIRDWIDFVSHFSSPEQTTDVRYIANVIYLLFKRAKLSDLFCEFQTKTAVDKTFTLVRR